MDDLLSDSYDVGKEKQICDLSQKLSKLSGKNKEIAYGIIELLTRLD